MSECKHCLGRGCAICRLRADVAKLREALTPFVVNRSYNPEILVEPPPDPLRLCAPLTGPMSLVIELADLRQAHRVMEETK